MSVILVKYSTKVQRTNIIQKTASILDARHLGVLLKPESANRLLLA